MLRGWRASKFPRLTLSHVINQNEKGCILPSILHMAPRGRMCCVLPIEGLIRHCMQKGVMKPCWPTSLLQSSIERVLWNGYTGEEGALFTTLFAKNHSQLWGSVCQGKQSSGTLLGQKAPRPTTFSVKVMGVRNVEYLSPFQLQILLLEAAFPCTRQMQILYCLTHLNLLRGSSLELTPAICCCLLKHAEIFLEPETKVSKRNPFNYSSISVFRAPRILPFS